MTQHLLASIQVWLGSHIWANTRRTQVGEADIQIRKGREKGREVRIELSIPVNTMSRSSVLILLVRKQSAIRAR